MYYRYKYIVIYNIFKNNNIFTLYHHVFEDNICFFLKHSEVYNGADQYVSKCLLLWNN